MLSCDLGKLELKKTKITLFLSEIQMTSFEEILTKSLKLTKTNLPNPQSKLRNAQGRTKQVIKPRPKDI